MATATAGWRGLQLDPLDVLFFRDGRPFDAASRVGGGFPSPQTLAGALRTALLARAGFDFRVFSAALRDEYEEAQGQSRPPDVKRALRHRQPRAQEQGWIIDARFRGPWLALARGGHQPVEPLLPQPTTLARRDSGGWLRSEPWKQSEIPGWQQEGVPSILPLWRRGKPDTKAGTGFLTLTGLRGFLNRRAFLNEATCDHPEFFAAGELYDFDNRIGIGIDKDTLTSADGDLYGIRLLSLRPRVRELSEKKGDPYHRATVCLYAEILPGEGAPALKPYLAGPLPLGGEGKYVQVTDVSACDWPTPEPTREQSLWYLATHTFLPVRTESSRSLPNVPGLRAAASSPGVAVSGWDVARNGPRPTRFAVPAGAVYFLDKPGHEDDFIGDCGDLKADDLRAEGWGFALQGIW